MALRKILKWIDPFPLNAVAVLSACLIGLFSLVSASAVENERLPSAGPAASSPGGFTQMPQADGTHTLQAQAAKASPAPATPQVTLNLTGEKDDALQPFFLRAMPSDTKPSAALILVGGYPTAVMTDDDPGSTSDQPSAPIRPAEAKEATQVNVFTGLGTTSAQNYTPLTLDQRWKYYLNQNFMSWGAIVGPLLSSVIDQINSQPPEWEGGIEGYGKRLASRLGTGIVQGTAQSAGCALLGQEPRYIKSSSTNIFARIGHGFLYSLITYNNDGKRRIALATLASYYASSITTNLWMPGRYTALGDGVRDGNRQVILAGFVNQWQEFWPEIRRYVLRRP